MRSTDAFFTENKVVVSFLFWEISIWAALISSYRHWLCARLGLSKAGLLADRKSDA